MEIVTMTTEPLISNFAGNNAGRALTEAEVNAVGGGDLSFTVSIEDQLTAEEPAPRIEVDNSNFEVDD